MKIDAILHGGKVKWTKTTSAVEEDRVKTDAETNDLPGFATTIPLDVEPANTNSEMISVVLPKYSKSSLHIVSPSSQLGTTSNSVKSLGEASPSTTGSEERISGAPTPARSAKGHTASHVLPSGYTEAQLRESRNFRASLEKPAVDRELYYHYLPIPIKHGLKNPWKVLTILP